MKNEQERRETVNSIDAEAHDFALNVSVIGMGYSLPGKMAAFTLMAPRILVAMANGNREDTLRAYSALQVRMLHEIEVALREFPEASKAAEQFAAVLEKEAVGGESH